MAAHDYEPVVRTVTVQAPIEKAFRVFTEDMGTWWPFEPHSIGKDKVVDAAIEGRAGGRIYEKWADGTTCDWGEVIVFDAPAKLVLSWKPNPDSSAPTEVHISFMPRGSSTEVRLEHRGWERLGDEAGPARDSYTSGWVVVMDRFEARFAA